MAWEHHDPPNANDRPANRAPPPNHTKPNHAPQEKARMDSLVTAYKASDMVRRNPLPEDSACVFLSILLLLPFVCVQTCHVGCVEPGRIRMSPTPPPEQHTKKHTHPKTEHNRHRQFQMVFGGASFWTLFRINLWRAFIQLQRCVPLHVYLYIVYVCI